MRVKKQRRHRKAVRFYAACHGFREPYKVLCDGSFVHHLLSHGLGAPSDALARLLAARTLPFSTRCINEELKREGLAEALRAAQQLPVARCDHERVVSATICIESVVAEGNPEHFFVATQDADLRKKFYEVPGVPTIYGLRKSLFIEQPSAHQREFVKSTEERRLRMTETEYQKLQKVKDKLVSQTDELHAEQDSGSEAALAQTIRKRNNARRLLGVAEKSKFKRKKAKGPNPLSCKKKKKEKKEDSSVAQNQDGKVGDFTKKKRNRKRKRAYKEGKSEDPGS